jgi:uncharacterized protein YndB with AHSA1/START domain
MTIISVDKDYDELSVTLVAEFDAPIDRVWELWSDPRSLERWLGPPTHPATVQTHELGPGGRITFIMTGPDGDRSWGIWTITSVNPPTRLEFTDAFADPDGAPLAGMPAGTVTVRLTEEAGVTRMELRTAFDSLDDMERWVGMGTVEGLQQAVAQMDGLLA